jgi:hypothetical protein
VTLGEFADVAVAEGLEVIATKAGEFAKEAPELAALGGVGQGIGGEGGDELAEGDRGQGGQVVGQAHDAGLFGEMLGVAGDGAGPVAGLLVLLPFEKSALPPFAEVLFVNGAAVEVAGERLLHWVLGVEPLDKGGALFAVVEAAVELFADGARQAGDFAVADHGGGGFRVSSFRFRVFRGEMS